MEAKADVARRLKHLRKSNDITIERLATLLNIKAYTIRRYENGEREPDLEAIKRYAETFYVSTDWILNYQVPILDNVEKIKLFDDLTWDDDKEEALLDFVVTTTIRQKREMEHHQAAYKLLHELMFKLQEQREEKELGSSDDDDIFEVEE